MGEERVVRRVGAATPDLTADAAMTVVVEFEAAGFRLDDYAWSTRRVRAPSEVDLAFVAGRSDAVAPPERPLAPPRRDDPAGEAKRLSIGLFIVFLVILGGFVAYGLTEQARTMELICSDPSFAGDYPEQCP